MTSFCSHIHRTDFLYTVYLQCQTSLRASARCICPWNSFLFVAVSVRVIHRDSSRGCCTVRRRGWRSLVSCCTPLFSESMIWSFSNFWYLSIIFLSNTNTATSCRGKGDYEWASTKINIPHLLLMRTHSSQLITGRTTHTHLFCGLLCAIVDPPAHARTPASNVPPDLELTCHRVAHDSTGDICRHLGDSAL